MFFVVLVLASIFGCQKGNDHAEHTDTYTCPMHPTVISDKQGTCPVCGMDLVLKTRTGEMEEIAGDLKGLTQSPNETIISSIRTLKGEFRSQPVALEVQGIVTYDTRYEYTIPGKIGGRLEKVYLNYAFQNVKKGQKVAEIYSPELLKAQRELLYLIENDSTNNEIIGSAKNKLHLLGASKGQVEEVIKRKKAQYIFPIYSPFDGYLIKDNQRAPSIGGALPLSKDDGMSGSDVAPVSPAMNSASPELLKAGQYVSAGQTLFKIVSTSALRLELYLPASKVGSIKVNDPVELDFGNGNRKKASIDLVQPFLTEGEGFLKVRVYVNNVPDLRIGQSVRAKLQLKSIEGLWLPKECVLDLGKDKIVFVKDHESFAPKKVVTGARTQGWIEIKEGLSSSQEIASNAQYLVDSESFIKSK